MRRSPGILMALGKPHPSRSRIAALGDLFGVWKRGVLTVIVAGGAGYGGARFWPVGLGGGASAKGSEMRVASASSSRAAAVGEAGMAGEGGETSRGRPRAEALFSEALAEKDLFRSVTKALEGVDALTAADFADFVAKEQVPEALDELLARKGSPLAEALTRSFVERWLGLDRDGGAKAILTLSKYRFDKPVQQFLYGCRYLLAELRPREYLESEATDFMADFPTTTRATAFRTIARENPAEARKLAARFLKEPQDAEEAILSGMAEADPLGAIRLAKDESFAEDVIRVALRSAERVGRGPLREILGLEALKSYFNDRPDHANYLAFRYPDLAPEIHLPEDEEFYFNPLMETEAASLLGSVPAEELKRRLAESDKLPAPMRVALTAGMVKAWAEQEPLAAMTWAAEDWAKSKDTERELVVDFAFRGWQEIDPKAALAWWQALPSGPVRASLANRAAVQSAEAGDLEAALRAYGEYARGRRPTAVQRENDWFFGYAEKGRGYDFLMELQAERDPAGAVRWATDLPPVSWRATGPMRAAMEKWIARAPEEAADWVETQPAGVWRDAAAASLANALIEEDEAAATEWAEEVQEPEMRKDLANLLYYRLRLETPAAARAWLRALPGISPEWKDGEIRPSVGFDGWK